MVVAFFFAATSVRRQAISLLKSSPRKEGFMSSIVTAEILERAIEIEEEGFPKAQMRKISPTLPA